MDIQASETCVIVVDFQNDSCGVGQESQDNYKPILDAVERTRRLLAALRDMGIACVFTKHVEDAGNLPGNLQTLYNNKPNLQGGHYAKGKIGSELYGDLTQQGDVIFEKKSWGAFSNERLESYLNSLGIRNLIICGTETETCVLSTITQAFDLGYSIFLPRNCIATKATKLASHHSPVLDIFDRYYGYVLDEQKIISMINH